MEACKFAKKVWNAQEAGAQGVRCSATANVYRAVPYGCYQQPSCHRAVLTKAWLEQVLVVNYEDRLTTMEAPDDHYEVSYQYPLL